MNHTNFHKAPASHLMGNSNAIVGAMHKDMMAKRLSNPSDPLTRAIASAAGIQDLADCCTLRSGESEGLAESGAEIGMLAIGHDGREADIHLIVKTCKGFGSSTQSARFWAQSLLDPSDAGTPAERALHNLCGSMSLSGARLPISTPGHLVSHAFEKAGLPLQLWLAKPSTLSRIACAAYGVEPSTPRGRKLLLLTLRGAGPDGDDLHLLADRADLRDHAIANSTRQTKDGRAYLPIGASDDAIEFTPILRMKRKGGDSGGANADQIQTAISPPETLRAIATSALPGQVLREEPTHESLCLDSLSRAGSAETATSKPALLALAKRAATLA